MTKIVRIAGAPINQRPSLIDLIFNKFKINKIGAYKWKPSKSQKREFAQKMQNDPVYAANYYARKELKKEKNRQNSKFDYTSAGGYYIPTREQWLFVMNNPDLFVSEDDRSAANMVATCYSIGEKCHHDYIHIVNEIRRNNPNR